MTGHGILTWAIAACAASALAGCSLPEPPTSGGTPSTSETTPTTPLRGATIPANFTYQMNRGVQLSLSADQSLFGPKGVAVVEVTNSSNAVLYRGPIQSGHPLGVHLELPTKDSSLNVTFRTRGVEKNASLAVNDNAASYTFQ
jgi:hypothetical protein